MENLLEDDSLLELQIDEAATESLENASWWARFISIVCIVFFSLIVIMLIAYGLLFKEALTMNVQRVFSFYNMQGIEWLILVLVLIFFAIFLAPIFIFSTKTLSGINQNDQQKLEKGISFLKIYFIVVTIFTGLASVTSLINFSRFLNKYLWISKKVIYMVCLFLRN